MADTITFLLSPQYLNVALSIKHSSVLSRYNPFSDSSISPKIPRTTNGQQLVGVNQCSRSVCLILCDISFIMGNITHESSDGSKLSVVP